jgi:hypothetical protein
MKGHTSVPQPCSRSLPRNVETIKPRNLREPSRSTEQPGNSRILGPQPVQTSITKSIQLNREQRIRHAVLRGFCGPPGEWCSELETLTQGEWKRLLRWLDLTGLALYFFDRLSELRLDCLLPAPVSARLRQNLADNSERTAGMTAESIEIQREFQGASVCYAVSKGLSLWPNSVPRPELRAQFDLDFLIAEHDLPIARKILARRGYRLYGTSGRSWEFKRNERPGFMLKDLYKHLDSWIVELHAEPDASLHASVLRRTEWRQLAGFSMPVLAPTDLFLRQGKHVYKHICGEFLRAVLLVEFRRHVLFRSANDAFWRELQSGAHEEKQARLALGVAALLISRVMGEFAPEALTGWTVDRLPGSARRWVEQYGCRAALGSFPGSKLYLFLQSAVEAAGGPGGRQVRQSLIPLWLPPPAIRASPNEPFSQRCRRYRMQLGVILGRLRFHVWEGLRYVCERRRWHRSLEGIAS